MKEEVELKKVSAGKKIDNGMHEEEGRGEIRDV